MADETNIIWNETEKYKEFRGMITGIDPVYEGEEGIRQGDYLVHVADGDNPAAFYINKNTFYLDCSFTVGDQVFGYYRTDRPMILIYPPRYDIVIFGLVKEGRNVKVGAFDNQLVSSDGMLKLNISELTWISDETGKVYCDNIENKDLLVLYGASTRSIPAFTVPGVIFVISE